MFWTKLEKKMDLTWDTSMPVFAVDCCLFCLFPGAKG